MIICDPENIDGAYNLPSREVIEREWRKQTEALKDIRRRLEKVISAEPAGLIQAKA